MDIDLDFADRTEILSIIKHRVASLKDGKKHNTGIYITEIPFNPETNQATIDYKDAEQRGYFKIDILNVSIYKGVKSHQHLNDLINKEPIWDLLLLDNFVNNVFHLANHGDVLRILQPKSIKELAAVLAIIRPAKKYLIDKDWDTIFKEAWIPPEDGSYYFKKAHAFSYAMAVVVHMNLLCEQMLESS